MAKSHDPESLQHPVLSRRSIVQAGAVGALGMGMTELASLRAFAELGRADRAAELPKRAKAVIFIYAIGGMSQLETFDMKPQAPADIRGEFQSIDTSIPGIAICEHLPMLARRSRLFSLVRSVSHPHNSHLNGCMVMQSGRSALPLGFKGPSKRTDWPGIAAIAGYATKRRGVLPAAMILPELTYHNRANLVPGQTAGMMGPRHDPWVMKAASRCLGQGYNTRGACPDCFEFITFKGEHRHQTEPLFATPRLELPAAIDANRFSARLKLLAEIDHQRRELDQFAGVAEYDRHRQQVTSLLTDGRTRDAFDIMKADRAVLERYGQNKFGWSLLMARRLVDVGVNMVQVNLGHNFTWDTHGAQFPILKDRLLPPTDRAVSALLDDLEQSGRLDDVLVVLASEFGRTPKVFRHKGDMTGLAGRGHWGPVQSVLLAGGGVRGGMVVGASDKQGGFPISDKQKPEDFAATIFHLLGIPQNTAWNDQDGRPHHIYHGQPIEKLLS